MHDSRGTPGRYEIAVLANGLDLVAAIAAKGGDGLSTAEATRIIGISRTSVYRLLVTLESRSFVERNADEQTWTLGARLFALASRASADKLRQVALAPMRRLLDEESETVNLALFSGSGLVYLETMDSPHPFRMSEGPGDTAPLHATALGKAVLAR